MFMIGILIAVIIIFYMEILFKYFFLQVGINVTPTY